MQTPYYGLGYKIDLYFPDYNIAIEDDKFNRIDRYPKYEAKRPTETEEDLIVRLLDLIQLMHQILKLIRQ